MTTGAWTRSRCAPGTSSSRSTGGSVYLDLHHGKLPPKKNHCASDGAEANCGTGRSGFTVDPYGNILPCVAFRRTVANIKDLSSLNDIWGQSPVLAEVRQMAVDARTNLNKHEDGQYFAGFCLEVAEKQVGDPLGLYPQAEINAKAVRRAYELLQIGEPSRG